MKPFGGQSPPGSGLRPGTRPRRQAATRPIIEAFFHVLRFLLKPTVRVLCALPHGSIISVLRAVRSRQLVIPAGLFRNKGGGQQQMPCSWWLSICIFFCVSFWHWEQALVPNNAICLFFLYCQCPVVQTILTSLVLLFSEAADVISHEQVLRARIQSMFGRQNEQYFVGGNKP